MEQSNDDATALLKTLLERFNSLERDVTKLKEKQARRNPSAAGSSGTEAPMSTADDEKAGVAPEGRKATSQSSSMGKSRGVRQPGPRETPEKPRRSRSPRQSRRRRRETHSVEGLEPMNTPRRRKGSCGCKTTNTARLPAASRKAKGSPGHLEGDHKRPVGGYHNKGLQDRLPVRTSPESETSHSTILCGTESIDSGGDKGTSGQRSHSRCAQPSGRVLLKLVPCPKKGQWATPSNKPEGPEQFCSDRALQNGGNPYPQRPCQSGGLDGKGGSEGCVFRNPNPQITPSIPEISLSGEMLSVPVPTIWPVIGSLGLYQDPEASTSSPPGDGCATDSNYIDDILILAESQEQARNHAEALVYLLQCLGFKVNQKKSVLEPAQVMEFLGFTVDTVHMELKLPLEKIKKIRAESRSMVREDQVSGRALARLVGKMNATSQVIPPAPLLYRHLQMALSATLNQHSQCYEAMVPLTTECREELMWWDTHMINWNGKSLLKKEVDMIIDSDASLIGWGATS